MMYYIAKKWTSQSEEQEDIVQEALMKLVEIGGSREIRRITKGSARRNYLALLLQYKTKRKSKCNKKYKYPNLYRISDRM